MRDSAAKVRGMRIPKTAAALLGGLALGWVVAEAGQPPVMRDLGQVNPTPVPTEKTYRKMRLISSLTVQNSPEGETVITFEASDVGKTKDGKFKNIAAERYSLGEVKQKYLGQREEIIRNLRVLEDSLIRYVDSVGGPHEHEKDDEKKPD